MLEIPTFQDQSADFVQTIELNEQLVEIRVIFNVRNEFFHMDFFDQNGDAVYGIKMVPNWPLLKYHKGFIDFDGDIMVLAKETVETDEITYDNFGPVWGFYYLTEDEVEAWEVENGLQ